MKSRILATTSFTDKMNAMIDLYGYSESDFEFYNQAYELFDSLTDEQIKEIEEYLK